MLLTDHQAVVKQQYFLFPSERPTAEPISAVQAQTYELVCHPAFGACMRLNQATEAMRRLARRRQTRILPPRRAFATTVDYYEAILPLYAARSRFVGLIARETLHLRSLHAIAKELLPQRLF